MAAVAAALAFDDPADAQSVDLQRMLRELRADAFTTEVMGLAASHPLYPAVRDAVAARQVGL